MSKKRIVSDLSGELPREQDGFMLQLHSIIKSALCPEANGYHGLEDQFRNEYLVSEVLSKFPFKNGIDKAKVALEKFKETELICSLTNLFVSTNTAYGTGYPGLTWHAVMSTARRKVELVLGPFNWDLAEEHFNFGPGATTSRKRCESDAYHKIRNKPDVTPDCALLGWCAVYRIPAWFETLTGSRPSCFADDLKRFPPEEIFRLVAGNKVVTVPKNSKTDRVIAIEPDLNMFVQKGIGGLIRKRLRRVGVNLNDQSFNQHLALVGSRDGCLATVDFSSASDTISIGIVEELLPGDWLLALKQCRSPCGSFPDGSVVQYSKFSSMGNGYTFELESLIFWALAKACAELLGCKGSISVYGDDLIVPVSLEDPLRWVFARAGFTLNAKKSFFSGPFRESCGKHFYRGVDVTPFYIKHPLRNVFDVFSLCNRIDEWSRMTWGRDGRMRPLWEHLVNLIPRYYRVPIPPGVGDVGLISDPVMGPDSKTRFNRRSYRLKFPVFLPVFKSRKVEGLPLVPKWFLKGSEESRVEDIVAYRVRAAKLDYFEVSQWPSYGPWL